ncbi:protein SOB FIVE-LIKE 4-like [Zingiber officinale]|uniref:protein SOB FIVE-LIKE 4-like n=1 Tax=Zingiber officinale TaxID=94328 RepID=UPI001C4AFBE9|nr:protein SOB FIVE-LIKE 4-like [Zingiber officinale]
MESSCVSGEREEEEECDSSQSGWTMYIDTPTYQDDAGNDSNYSNVVVDDNEEVGIHDDNEDDSLASDASSTWCERRNAENHKVDDEDEDVNNEDDNESCGVHHPRPSRNVVQKESKVSRNV